MKNKIQIVIEDKKTLKEWCDRFLEEIELSNKEFIENLNKNLEKWKWLDNEENKHKFKCYIYPENIKYKSPVTIFDGEWGIGKTKFFEELIINWKNNFINKNCQNFYFSSINLIDLWEYSNSDNITNEILKKIFGIIIEQNDCKKNRISWHKVFVYLSKFLEFGTSILLEKITSKINPFKWLSTAIYNKILKKEEKVLTNIIKDMKPMIIIFDNLERLGDISYEIVKLIQKISMIPNLIIILSLNKKQLISNFYNLNQNQTQGELWIDKYITLKNEFYFKQSFKNFFIGLKINKRTSSIINNFLLDSGEIFSIRQLEKSFNNLTIELLNKWFSYSDLHGLVFIENKFKINKKYLFNFLKNQFNELKSNFIYKQMKLWTTENREVFSNFKTIVNIIEVNENDKIFYNKFHISNIYMGSDDDYYKIKKCFNLSELELHKNDDLIPDFLSPNNFFQDIDLILIKIQINLIKEIADIKIANINGLDLLDLETQFSKLFYNEKLCISKINFQDSFLVKFSKRKKTMLEKIIKSSRELNIIDKMRQSIYNFRDQLDKNLSIFLKDNPNYKYWFNKFDGNSLDEWISNIINNIISEINQ